MKIIKSLSNWNNLILFLLILFFPICSSERLTYKRKLNQVSQVVLIISGNGEQSILSQNFNTLPSEIFINGEKMNSVSKSYTLSESENNITMIWDNSLQDCTKMFYNLKTITKIDLSKFDSSNVQSFSSMFYGCSKLAEINFSNLDTTKVKTMDFMFYECDSLISLDLSMFNTPNLENAAYMIYDCDNLI